MGLMKFLPWIIIAGIALFYFSRMKQQREKKEMEEELQRMRRELAGKGGAAQSSRMEQCPHCGTYFPHDEGVVKGGRLYCSKKCARSD